MAKIDELAVGQEASLTRVFSQQDVGGVVRKNRGFTDIEGVKEYGEL